jgi:transcriptional regulator with XRE-family HTH domain
MEPFAREANRLTHRRLVTNFVCVNTLWTMYGYSARMSFSAEALGAVIREHREAAALTQEYLGTKAGYGSGAAVSISRIENGLTRPSDERLDGIAYTLGLTRAQLQDLASQGTHTQGEGRGGTTTDRTKPVGDESVKQRAKRIQQESENRAGLITDLAEAFNEAHDRARDDFFMKFVEIASQIDGAEPPESAELQIDDAEDSDKARTTAAYRLRFTSYGVAKVLAGGAGGAAAGAAVGGAAAYTTFVTAVAVGSASTGTAIAGLSGVAATNAALALLGGGTLAAGGAGVAGGAALLAGIVAAPALLLTVGGLVWMVRRNRKQQQELAVKLDEAEDKLDSTRKGFDACTDILQRATKILDYIAVHASHAVARWESGLNSRPLEWNSMADDEKQRYGDFVEVAAAQLSVATINVQDLMTLDDEDLEDQIHLADEVLKQARARISSLV